MSSCSATPVKWDISPSRTGSCDDMSSCSASSAKWAISCWLSECCAKHSSCNAGLLKEPRRQYPGCDLRHRRTRSTWSGPLKYSRFPAFAHHRACAFALLARLHSGAEQWRWRSAVRGSGRYNSLQCKHLRCLLRLIHPSEERSRASKKENPQAKNRRGRNTTSKKEEEFLF